MKHYVVSYIVDYEESVIVGIFSTLKKAKKCFNKEIKLSFDGKYVLASEVNIVLWQGETKKIILEETYEKWRVKNV